MRNVHWDMLVKGYNDANGTSHSLKSMMICLDAREKSMKKVADILGVSTSLVHQKMHELEIPTRPRGHLHPTKMDKLMEISDYELAKMSNRDISEKLNISYKGVSRYRKLRRERQLQRMVSA